MARLIWIEPALLDLDEVAEYIAIDDPLTASRYVQKVFDRVERLEAHPKSGKRLPELPRSPYREVVVPPCRVFYRVERDAEYILRVMRSERLFRTYLLDQKKRKK